MIIQLASSGTETKRTVHFIYPIHTTQPFPWVFDPTMPRIDLPNEFRTNTPDGLPNVRGFKRHSHSATPITHGVDVTARPVASDRRSVGPSLGLRGSRGAACGRASTRRAGLAVFLSKTRIGGALRVLIGVHGERDGPRAPWPCPCETPLVGRRRPVKEEGDEASFGWRW